MLERLIVVIDGPRLKTYAAQLVSRYSIESV